MTKVEAIYEKGVFRPVSEVNLEDGDIVELNFEVLNDHDPALSLLDLSVDSGVTDLAENLDHYLYGHPKQTDR